MYGKYNNTTSSPARDVFLITPGNNDLPKTPKALRADGNGTITFQGLESTGTVTINVTAGELIPFMVRKVTAATVVVHGLV